MPALALRSGVQTPTFESLPDDVAGSYGDEAIDLAAACGVFLDPWQQYALRGLLSKRPNGDLPFEAAILCPRQQGKNEIILVRELWGLFVQKQDVQLHSSHEFKTSLEAYRRLLSVIEGTDWLRKLCKKPKFSHGDEGIELLTGERLRFVARSSGSGRGFSASTVYLDESMILSEDSISAMMPALAAKKSPQIVYTSSAGLASSTVLRSVRDRGRAGDDPSLAYFEWCSLSDDLDDQDEWLRANPGVGYRLTLDHIARERAAMTDRAFARERLGVWEDVDGDGPVSTEAWAAIIDTSSVAPQEIAIAFDVNPERTSGSIALYGQRRDGIGHVELVDVRAGIGWMIPRLVDLVGSQKLVNKLACDPRGPAGGLIPELEAAGVDVLRATGTEINQACQSFLDAIVDGSLRHPGQPQLTAAVASGRQQSSGDAWRWSRRGHDISGLYAATLARYAFITQQPAPAADPVPSIHFI